MKQTHYAKSPTACLAGGVDMQLSEAVTTARYNAGNPPAQLQR